MNTNGIFKRFLAIFLVLSMLFGTAACAKTGTSLKSEKTDILSDVKEEYTREEMELIVDLLGDGQNTDDLTDDELKAVVDKIVSSNQSSTSSTVTNLSATTKKEQGLSTEGKEEFYGTEGEIKIPFDQIYPEAIEEELVEYSDETILVKLTSSKLTKGLKAAGVAALDEIIPLEENSWYEAKLKKGTDAKAAVEAVRELSEVVLAEFNYEVSIAAIDDYKHFDDKTDEEFKKNGHNKDQWHFHHVGIPDGYEEMEDEGGSSSVIVAVIDTGVDYDHEDLKDNIWVNTAEIPDNGRDDDGNGYVDDYYGVNIVAEKGNGDDDNGHGTHVAGIVAASNNNVGVVGVAYDSKIMPIKAAMHNGTLNQSDIARAVIYAYEMGAEVINMSFGGTGCTIAVQDALAVAYTRCVLVASAGNNGMPNEGINGFSPLPSYPAALSYVLGVMSVDQYGTESVFSNWDAYRFNGTEYELYAPGENIMSTMPNDQYGYLSGTSMAAPIVSAMAAILRGEFNDRNMYPTKFIYGQLASTSDYYADCLGPYYHGKLPHNIPQIVNLDAALTKLPKPEVNLQDFYIFDSVELSDKNNGDGVIDAGETIALGLTLRNRWGMSENTIVKIDTLVNGISDPYVTIVNDTVNYGSVGTYSTQDCGKIMTDGLFTGWEDPFIINIADDCPNDYQLTFNVTIECENALDKADETVYSTQGNVNLTARNGVILPSIIDEDMVLTKDNLYIIPNATVINKGATVRVEAGTNIQFWTDDPKDPYADTYIAYLLVNGNFIVEGTKKEPVYIYPSQLMDHYGVEIGASRTGNVSLKYADITNFFYYDDHTGTGNNINNADHCTFRLNYGYGLCYRMLNNGKVTWEGCYGITLGKINARNSVFYKIGQSYSNYVTYLNGFADRCIFVDCGINMEGSAQNCVFLGNSFVDQTLPYNSTPMSMSFYNETPYSILGVYYREETGTTYIRAEYFEGKNLLKEAYGLEYAVIETQDELNWLTSNLDRDIGSVNVGIYYDGQKLVWSDGTEIASFIDPQGLAQTKDPGSNSLTLYWWYGSFSCQFNSTSYEFYEIKGHILPTDITFDEYTVNIDTNSTYQLSPKNAPVQLPLNGFIYESSDESVIKVDNTGLVTPVGEGSADVWVYSLDRAVKNYVTFNVVDYVALEDLSFTEDILTIAKGETAKAKCIFTPDNTTRKNVTYSSDNTSVATVDKAGNVTAVGKGTANIIATCEGITATLPVKVYVKVTSFEFAEDAIYSSLADGAIALPEAIVDEGAEPELSWRSTDENVALVENGKIKLLKTGSTTIIATEKASGITASFDVFVFEDLTAKQIKDVQRLGYSANVVLFENGDLYIWENSIPQLVLSNVRLFSAATYDRYFVAVSEDGSFDKYEWNNSTTTVSKIESLPFTEGNRIADIEYMNCFGAEAYFVITDIGNVYAWGSPYATILGIGNSQSASTPTLVNLDGIIDIEANHYNSFFLLKSGELYSAGNSTNSSVPVLIDTNVSKLLSSNVINEELQYVLNNGTVKGYYGSYSYYSVPGISVMDEVSGFYDDSLRITTLKGGAAYYLKDGNLVSVDGITNAQKVFAGKFILTEDNKLYTLDSKSLGIYDKPYGEAVEVPLASDQMSSETVVITETNLSDNVLSENAIIIGFNKKILSANAKLYANGEQIPVKYEIIDTNFIKISRAAGFTEGVEYELVFEENSIKAMASMNLEEIRVSFTYEKKDAIPENPETAPEEAPTAPEDAPAIEKVIHEAVIDSSIERIPTIEKIEKELNELMKQYQFNDKFYGNAILNPFSTVYDVEKWFRPLAPSVNAGDYLEIPLGNNYWGTDNRTAIELQMVDYSDYISYGRFMYNPYMTEAPENTFPFVTSVKLFNEAGEEVTTVGNEKITFRVSFNRDMDTSIPLTVRFGSAYPYGDYEIDGQYVDARTWEGTYTLKTIIENGNQYFTIMNGCSATDDLELQIDRMRFGFVIDTTAAQALIMQGNATDTGVELKWTQDDFDTLMGYNVYRSDKEDGLYVRLNSTVIPADTMEFFDNTVEPGKVYYYNFTVVQTDLTESEPSGKISIMSKDTMAPDIYHSPVYSAFTGSNLVITATVTDNLNIAYANLYYRIAGEDDWKTVRMNALNDKYSAIIIAQDITVAGLEYYIEAFDGVSFTYKGGKNTPYTITVQEAISADALGDVDGDGTITNFDALLLLYAINDKYNMTAEQFARADLNGDGELWAAEALRILQYVSGVVGSLKIS